VVAHCRKTARVPVSKSMLVTRSASGIANCTNETGPSVSRATYTRVRCLHYICNSSDRNRNSCIENGLPYCIEDSSRTGPCSCRIVVSVRTHKPRRSSSNFSPAVFNSLGRTSILCWQPCRTLNASTRNALPCTCCTWTLVGWPL